MQKLLLVFLLITVEVFTQQGTTFSPPLCQNSTFITSEPNQRILIINSFDAMAMKARNNKRSLFKALADSLSIYLSDKVKTLAHRNPLRIPGILFKNSQLDSNVLALLKEKDAALAIVIWSVDARFEESGEKETEDSDGKTVTEVSYDLCVTNEYILYNPDKALKQSRTENCEYLTTRTVRGSFSLRFGPDIVGKRKHTYRPLENNASAYITEILPILDQY